MSKCMCKRIVKIVREANLEIQKHEGKKGLIDTDFVKTHKSMVFEKVAEVMRKEGIDIEKQV